MVEQDVLQSIQILTSQQRIIQVSLFLVEFLSLFLYILTLLAQDAQLVMVLYHCC